MINHNYNVTRENWLSDGSKITTWTDLSTGSSRIFTTISEESTLTEFFKEHVLFDAEPNQKNTFVYLPFLQFNKALVIEFGSQSNREGFFKPNRKILCMGSKAATPTSEKVICYDSISTRSETNITLSREDALENLPEQEKQKMHLLLQAEKIEDLPLEMQEELESNIFLFSEETQEKIMRNPKELLATFQTFARHQIENFTPQITPSSQNIKGQSIYNFENKADLDLLHNKNLEKDSTADFFSYTRIIHVAPETEKDTILTNTTLNAMTSDLNLQMELLTERKSLPRDRFSEALEAAFEKL